MELDKLECDSSYTSSNFTEKINYITSKTRIVKSTELHYQKLLSLREMKNTKRCTVRGLR